MRSFWNGNISFGLVNIPVSVYPATKKEEFSFHFLHQKDLGRIHNERVCEKCGRAVPYEDLVKGFEYEDDKFTPLTPEDLESIHLESTKTIDIQDFVDDHEIDPMFFEKPYYLVPDKKGEKAYALLREALKRTKKTGIAKVVFQTREHLAAVRAVGPALMLDVMHFATEFKKPEEMELPENLRVEKKELEMAEALIKNMKASFHPEKYKDTYQQNLNRVIEEKLEGRAHAPKQQRDEAATNVIDIMAKLKASLKQKTGKRKKKTA